MEQAGFWSRVGQWFKTSRRGDAPDVSLTRLPRGGLLGQEGPNPPADGLRTGLTFSRRRQREQAIEQLQEAYQQVAGLIESIVNHLQTQQERSGQVATALTRLAHTTTQVCEAAVAQSEQLGAIAAQLEAGNDRARRWEQTLFNLPKLAEGQREALTALRQELQAGQEADRRMIDTMEGFRSAITSWGESSAASTATLRELKEAAFRRDDALNTLIAAQGRRFTWLFVVTLALAAAAIATGIVGLFR